MEVQSDETELNALAVRPDLNKSSVKQFKEKCDDYNSLGKTKCRNQKKNSNIIYNLKNLITAPARGWEILSI